MRGAKIAGLLSKYKNMKPLNTLQKNQVKSKVNRMISSRAEKKIFTTDVVGAISATPAFNQVSSVPQGDLDTNRNGDELYLKSLHFNWAMVGADSTNRMRLIVLQWHGDSGTNPPTAIDLFQVNTLTGYFGAFRKDTSQMYSILYDKFIDTNTYSQIRHAQKNMYRGFRKKLKYQAASASVGTGQIYTCLVSDSTAVSHPAIDSQFAIRYTDS